MPKSPSAPTRVTADVVARATSVARAEHRTVTEQISHWARIGMQVERSGTLSSRRVLDVANGTGQFADLDADERVAAHALIDADNAGRAATESFGAVARASGRRTVSLDDDGHLIEITPDGSTRRL